MKIILKIYILEIQNMLHKLLAQILLESYNPLYDKFNILVYYEIYDTPINTSLIISYMYMKTNLFFFSNISQPQ